jgi:hypothetical protein
MGQTNLDTKSGLSIRQRLAQALAGELPADVRTNMRIEMVASVAYGVFFAAAVSLLPVVLRRMGAASGLLALYMVQTYLGSILALR